MGMSYADTPSIWEGCIYQQGLWKSRHYAQAAEEQGRVGQQEAECRVATLGRAECVDPAKMLRRELSLATEFSYNSAISIPCQGCLERGPQKTAVARLSSRTTSRLHNTILQRRSQPSPASPKSECQWWSYHTPRSLMDITSKQKNIEERNIEEEAMTAVKRSKLPTM